MTAHRALGLVLMSQRTIPGVAYADPGSAPDVVIHWEDATVSARPAHARCLYETRGASTRGEPYFSVWQTTDEDAYISCRHTSECGAVTYELNRAGSRIRIRAESGMPPGDVDAYLTGPVFGCLLRLRGDTLLHGAAVAIGGQAVALLGAKGAGKSTLTAAFAEAGHAVLSDDIVLVRDGLVECGYPRLRVWPDSETVLDHLCTAALPPVLSFMEKRMLALSPTPNAGAWRFQSTPLPLAAIFVLGASEPEAGAPVSRVPDVRRYSQALGLIALARNVYAPYVGDAAQRARDMAALGSVARQLPVFSVSASRGRTLLRATRAAIVACLPSVSAQVQLQ